MADSGKRHVDAAADVLAIFGISGDLAKKMTFRALYRMQVSGALKIPDLAIGGEDVMRILGIPPSREIGEILEKLLERVIDDQTLNEREKLEALVPEIAKELKK